MIEYAVWGLPGSEHEQIDSLLVTGIHDVDRIEPILAQLQTLGCKNLRVQKIDLSEIDVQKMFVDTVQ